jgi:formate hydrogenlyase subunit 6/NADH:ubiquinone oxidoreductase subunit I
MFRIIVDSLKTGIVTEQRPFDLRPPFGFPVIDFARCTLCEECARSCPTGAIHSAVGDGGAAGQRTLTLSYASCIQCRACVDACGENAVSAGRDGEIAAHSRQQLSQTASFDADAVTGRCRFRQVEPQVGPSLEESAAHLRERIRGRPW